MSIKHIIKKKLLSSALDTQISSTPKEMGSFGCDIWGFNIENFKVGVGLFKLLYDKYFRVKAYGLENIPQKGRVLVIANHSGQIPFDGALTGLAMILNPNAPRIPKAMVERFFPTVPFLNICLSQMGAVIGDPVNCVKMLEHEEAVIVFPEGVRGSGKLFKNRYQLQRFGQGFMHIAMNTNTPIIPVGIVGCEETMPSIGNLKTLAKLMGLPYIPVTTLLPLPAKVFIYFGKPMRFKSDIINETIVNEKVEQVKNEIRHLIKAGLLERKGIFI